MRPYGKSPWISKPPLGTKIKGSDPLANGLIGAWLFNEKAGDTFLNVATPHHGISTGTGNAWKVGRLGTGLTNTTGNGGINIADEAVFDVGLNFSVAVGFVLEQSPGITAPIVVKWEEVLQRSWAIGLGSTNLLRGFVSYDGVLNNNVSGSAITVGALNHVVFAYDGVAQTITLYKNGVVDAVSGATGGGQVFNSTSPVQFNRATFGGGTSNNFCTFYYAYIWNNRVLSKGDAVRLMLNPYALATPRRRSLAAKYPASAYVSRMFHVFY